MTKRVSRVRGQVPRKARFHPEMTPRQAAFLDYLKSLGYGDDDVVYRPANMRILLKNDERAVCRVYVPTFFVVPESTLYDVDSGLTLDQEGKLAFACERDGHVLRIVSEADFPFDEYVGTEVVTSHA